MDHGSFLSFFGTLFSVGNRGRNLTHFTREFSSRSPRIISLVISDLLIASERILSTLDYAADTDLKHRFLNRQLAQSSFTPLAQKLQRLLCVLDLNHDLNAAEDAEVELALAQRQLALNQRREREVIKRKVATERDAKKKLKRLEPEELGVGDDYFESD